MTRKFDVYGVGIELSAPAEGPGVELMKWIGEDFSYFETEQGEMQPELSFVLGRDAGKIREELRGMVPAFRTRMCRAYGWGKNRACDYGDGVVVVSRIQPRIRRVVEVVLERNSGSACVELAYEALYGAFLSSLGESLDRKGYHRVHALGLARGEGEGRKTALVLLPTGAGKSAMAALLMTRPEFRIFSDESPLLHEGRIYPFPVRGALRPEVARALGVGPADGPAGGPESGDKARVFRRKHFGEKLLLPFDPERVAEPGPADWILVGRKAGSPRIRPGGARLAALSGLLDSSVIGRGLAQMSEYMIRGDAPWNLPTIAWSRLQSVRKLLRKANVGWFDVSDDAHRNARALADFLA